MPPLPVNNKPAAPTQSTVDAVGAPAMAQSTSSGLSLYPAAPTPTPTPVQSPAQAPVQPVVASVTQSAPVASQPLQTTSTGQSAPNVPPGLDPTAYTLTKAIAMQEGGGQILPWTHPSGDSGALPTATTGQGGGTYQFTPATWANDAQQVLGDPNAPMTADNQNKVAYTKVYNWLNTVNPATGVNYTPAEVASMWNAGPGSPNSWQPGTVQKVGNTPQYVANVQKYAEQLWNGATPTPTTPQATASQSPSIGGFLSNVIGSGASFLGNLGNAVMHPINTVENLAAIPVGALQQLGGETTPNTAIFDQVANTYAKRYGSLGDIANTLYTDPVGFLADLSTVAGGAAGVAGVAGKLADVGGLGDLATAGDAANAAGIDHIVNAAGDVMPTVAPVEASGVAGAAQAVQQTLSKISHLSNPLTPVVSGGMALASKGEGAIATIGEQVMGISSQDVSTIMKYPNDFTPEQMATVSRAGLAQEVQGAFKARMSALSETSGAYNPIREDTTPIKVSPTFLDEQFRKTAKVDVTDGQITATPDSITRAPSEISKLQQTYNFWKPTFQSGEMTPGQFLNFRQDVGTNLAKFEGSPIKNSTLSAIGKQIYHAANEDYRSQVPGLDAVDSAYSSQRTELDVLRKGLFSPDGTLLDSAINKIANAANKGNDKTLARLETLFPGITKRVQVLKTVETIQSLNGPKVGAYGRSIFGAARLGGYAAAASTGDIHYLAGAMAIEAIQRPSIAVPLIRAVAKIEPAVVNATLANMTRYVVMGASTLNVSSQEPTATQAQQQASPEQGAAPQASSTPSLDGNTPLSGQPPSVSTGDQTTLPTSSTQPVPYSSLFSLASSKGITQQQVTDALNGGYSEAQVQQYLASLK